MGIVQAQKDISSYYIIGYYSTNEKLDGQFRRIKITFRPELAAKYGAKLELPPGLFRQQGVHQVHLQPTRNASFRRR